MADGRDIVREPLALLLDRLDMIIDLLRINVGLEAQYAPELRGALSPMEISQDTNTLMELFLAGALPSAPATTEEFTVTNVERELARNESIPIMRIDVSNDNVAQPLWVTGKKGVLITTGRAINPQETIPFIIPRGHTLWGICAIPNISVRVATGHDFYAMLQQMKERGEA